MSKTDVAILAAHLGSTLFMTGLIWFVQVVHYPLKSVVGQGEFVRYQALHVARTGWVVGPPMLIEAATALWLVLCPIEEARKVLCVVGLLLLVKVWVVTALFSVPAHHALSRGFDRQTHTRLVLSNWARTFGWTARSVVVGWYAFGFMVDLPG